MINRFFQNNSKVITEFCNNNKLKIESVKYNFPSCVDLVFTIDTDLYDVIPSLAECSKQFPLSALQCHEYTTWMFQELFNHENKLADHSGHGSGLKVDSKDFHNNLKTGGI
jgi:hypothetical protein